MKKLLFAVLLLAGVAAMVPAAEGQAAVYGEFSGAKLQNLVSDNALFGATVGALVEGPKVLHGRLTLGGDLETHLLHKSNFNYDTLTVGARASISGPLHLRPYAGFNFGFGRLKNPADQPQATTDALIEVKVGAAKKISRHFDAVAEYDYQQFYALGGEYNPKVFSLGAVYYFEKR